MAATLPLLAAAVAAGSPAVAAASPQGHVVAGGKPAWTAAAADRGQTAASHTVNARVYLTGDQAGLEQYVAQASNPSSSAYGHYLSPAQVQQRFGATKAQIAKVVAWLNGAGFHTSVDPAGTFVSVSGDATAAQRAFGVKLHDYAVSGHVYHAPAGATVVPAAVADAVLSVTGLSDKPTMATHDDSLPGPGAAFVNAGPMSGYYGQDPAKTLPKAYGRTVPYVVKGYNGHQLRAAYGATASGKTGKGVTVAIVDAYDSPTIKADIRTYAHRNGDAAYKAGQFKQYDPAAWTQTADNQCGASGWYGEQTLDIEAVHAVAPAADIRYVGAASCQDPDLIDALNKIVTSRLATIVSDSWGEPENGSDPASDPVYNNIFLRGAAEGIGFYFSSGDNGDEVANTGTKQSDMPASLPYVTAVGGTSLAVGKRGNYEFETGWGTGKASLSADGKSWTGFPGSFHGGAGGGTSARTPQPWFQNGIVPSALANVGGKGAKRVVPDVAAVADPNTGFLVGQTQTFPDKSVKYSEYRIGGTSLASPVFAAIQALAQQEQGFPLGFADPAIYARHGLFHDVTDHPFGPKVGLAEARVDFVNSVNASGGLAVSVRTLGQDSSLQATKGYDDVTGVGSPTAKYIESYNWRAIP
ncbi:serine protease [Streptacidiphilus pinicola]|uniref:Serine protease n=1 Tax=Streptacidiphilus pinicola TaxID=2219663 RepID=A0A2X0IU56_9ACTN|nr:S53 family peptidase [Streptacidiphilus pinicola]RAG86891.1 serine protease [Streptacidiphilus pinicola]